jgi:hypothetical protein
MRRESRSDQLVETLVDPGSSLVEAKPAVV